MEIVVHIFTKNRAVILPVEPTCTVDTLKALIQWKARINPDEYVPLFGNKPLDDGRTTLYECGIKDRDAILLCPEGTFPISIHLPNLRCFQVEVQSFETVDDLKDKICGQSMAVIAGVDLKETYQRSKDKGTGYTWENMFSNYIIDYLGTNLDDYHSRLVHYDIIPLPDTSSIYHFFVYPRDEYPVFPMKIVVQIYTKSTSVTLTVKPFYTVEALKALIRREARIHQDVYIPLFSNKPLDDGLASLNHCGINDQGVILLCPKGIFPISVYMPWVGHFQLEVQSFETVGSVKEKIHTRTGVAPEKQHLYYVSTLLDDNEIRLVDYEIIPLAVTLPIYHFYVQWYPSPPAADVPLATTQRPIRSTFRP